METQEEFPDLMPEVDDAVNGMGQGFVQRLIERMGGLANAEAVFGRPVEHEGVKVIPVARVMWGAGGGGGADVKGSGENAKTDAGSGGGGGVHASPVGYIEISHGQARFVRFRDPLQFAGLGLAAAVSFWIVLRALRGLFR